MTSASSHGALEFTLGPLTLGEALRMLRHRARQNRDQVALASGTSAGAISNYENDVSVPPAPTLRRISLVLATMLDVDPRELWEQFGKVMDAASRRLNDDREQAEAGDLGGDRGGAKPDHARAG